MSSTRTIALFGYGLLGKPIAEALSQAGAAVVVFSRDPSKISSVPANIKLVAVDYTDEPKLAALLKDNAVDVVVSTLTTAVVTTDVQVVVARAAKAAGVKLFLPSEFGAPTDGHTGDTMFAAKNSIAGRIREVGPPTARIHTGLFMEVLERLTSNPAKPDEFIIAGSGNTPFTATSISDIAGFVAHILTATPLSDLEDSILLVEGQRITLNEAAVLYNKTPTYVSLDSLPHPFVKNIFSAIDAGWSRTGFDIRNPDAPAEVVEARSARSNALWEGHQWKQLKDLLTPV